MLAQPGDAEDSIEDDASKPGKIIAVADGDSDGDGVPDYADGFVDGSTGMSPAGATGKWSLGSQKFVPVVLTVPDGLTITSSTKFKLSYDANDPLNGGVVPPSSSSSEWSLGSGSLRLWKNQNSATARDAHEPIADPKGEFIKSGVDYLATDLGFTTSHRSGILWLEALKPSALSGDKTISVAVASPQLTAAPTSVRATTFKLSISRLTSDQFAGSSFNYTPGGNGYHGPDYSDGGEIAQKPYILMATRADGFLYAHADIEVTPAAVRDLLTFAVAAKPTTGAITSILAEQSATRTGSTLTLSANPGTMSVDAQYFVEAGFDLSHDGVLQDGTFSSNERKEVVSGTQAPMRVVTQNAYAATVNFVGGGTAALGGPYTKNFIYAFLHDSGIAGAINTPSGTIVTAGEYKYTHNVGAIFNATGVAPVNLSRFTMTSGPTLEDGSILSQDVAQSNALRRLVDATLFANEGVVQAWFSQHSDSATHTFTFDSAQREIKFFGSTGKDADFATSLGDTVSDDVKVSINVGRTWYFAQPTLTSSTVSLSGKLTDLVDFDLDSDVPGATGLLLDPKVNKAGATIQAGYNSLGVAGHVYKYEIDLTGTPALWVAWTWGNAGWAPGEP